MAWKSLLICAGALFFGAASLQAQSTATGRVGANIIHPAQAISASDMTFTMQREAGRVQISPDGTVSLGGKAISTEGAANLVLKGAPRTALVVCLPEKVDLTGPMGQRISAHGLRSNFTTGATNSQGERQVGMGGAFDVPASAAAGRYVGTMDVLIAYN